MARKTGTRGIRDEMNVGPDPRNTRHLVPMKELRKFEVADGDPDVRGWDVYTSTGREIGEVEDLLVDVDTGNVVMLDVDLRGQNRHTLAPIRAAWIDRGTRRVVVDAGEIRDGLDELPTFGRSASVTDDEIDRFDERYTRAYGRHIDDNEYRLRHGDDELRFGRRRSELDNDAERALAAERERSRDEVDRETPVGRTRYVEREAAPDTDRYQFEDREGRVRYADSQQEEVIERHPYVEEIVVRRRLVDDRSPEGEGL